MKTEQTEKTTLLGSVRGENTGQMAGEIDKEDIENNNPMEWTLQEPMLDRKPWTVIDELLEAYILEL